MLYQDVLVFQPSNILTLQVTQYRCDYNNLAPDGCTQYFFGETGQMVRTYNYQSGTGRQLADQNQNVCIR